MHILCLIFQKNVKVEKVMPAAGIVTPFMLLVSFFTALSLSLSLPPENRKPVTSNMKKICSSIDGNGIRTCS